MMFLKSTLRVASVMLLVGFTALVSLTYLHMMSPFEGYHLLLARFLSGFWFFLRDHFPAISWDAGTWGPGLAAFLIAALFAHRILSAWAAGTNRHWTLATSLCVALVVPVLFVIAFIVPGVLLQWEMLRQVPWINSNR